MIFIPSYQCNISTILTMLESQSLIQNICLHWTTSLWENTNNALGFNTVFMLTCILGKSIFFQKIGLKIIQQFCYFYTTKPTFIYLRMLVGLPTYLQSVCLSTMKLISSIGLDYECIDRHNARIINVDWRWKKHGWCTQKAKYLYKMIKLKTIEIYVMLFIKGDQLLKVN